MSNPMQKIKFILSSFANWLFSVTMGMSNHTHLK